MVFRRSLSTAAKWLALELIAVFGAVAYVLLSNFLPESGGQMLAATILLLIVAAVGYRLVWVLRNSVPSVDREPK